MDCTILIINFEYVFRGDMVPKLFTIIICSYNGERCLGKVIRQILDIQGYDRLVEEFILVNNNSNDATEKIMHSFRAKKSNIIVVNEVTPGLSNARLCGVKRAHGQWIVFIDDDNFLKYDWLIEAEKYIGHEIDVGVFGGAIIPKTEYVLSEENGAVLNKIYKSLAITHLSELDIDYNQKTHPNGKPMGAGMVIHSNIIMSLIEDGWLKMEGRKGEKLTSGEDTEICIYAEKKGYKLGYDPRMLIEHDISPIRLTIEYAKKLMWSIYESIYLLSGRDNKSILRRFKYILNMCIHKIHKPFRKSLCTEEQKLGYLLDDVYDEVMLHYLQEDRFILRS